jgi:hypothetical protein
MRIFSARAARQPNRSASSVVIRRHWITPSLRVRSSLTKNGVDGNPSAMQTQVLALWRGELATGVNLCG